MGLIEKTFRRLRLGGMKEKGDVGMKHCETQNLKFLHLKSCCVLVTKLRVSSEQGISLILDILKMGQV